ncbi:hydroxyisourate hydrolase [Oceanisphaera avium]|uniref:5-hydroxyisourate hydrolase n=1 Tax=Oceanisphaera avium TaxID=1903694 RepID=A0A1Y0CXG9_9GAMM|nr:hydroxyisourate hydrolase [Oceanisphaera avium]ART80020.1 hydroxyisourate hydrolase [Oceanisphaera avium]
MKKLAYLMVGTLLASSAGLALAADNPLSVHVLNLENGLPSSGVEVMLEQQAGDSWTKLNSGITNEQGRIPALYPEGKKLEEGVYRVTFETGDWFKKHDTTTFFPEVPVIFTADASVEHYHIPLLLSPYGFSTYRGN